MFRKRKKVEQCDEPREPRVACKDCYKNVVFRGIDVFDIGNDLEDEPDEDTPCAGCGIMVPGRASRSTLSLMKKLCSRKRELQKDVVATVSVITDQRHVATSLRNHAELLSDRKVELVAVSAEIESLQNLIKGLQGA